MLRDSSANPTSVKLHAVLTNPMHFSAKKLRLVLSVQSFPGNRPLMELRVVLTKPNAFLHKRARLVPSVWRFLCKSAINGAQLLCNAVLANVSVLPLKMSIGEKDRTELQKSHLDVLGICCISEAALIERILMSPKGVHNVSVHVPSKSVIVTHDPAMISEAQIVAILNSAKLEASVRELGTVKNRRTWPSPFTVVSGVLLLLSLTKFWFKPMHWLALGAVVTGLPQVVVRSFATIQQKILDINSLMLIAVAGTIALKDYEEAGCIVFLFALAEWLESMTSQKAQITMSALMNMAPQKAMLAETGEIVDTREVPLNTILAVKAGEMVPIDGIVVEGRSEVDEKSLTGEPLPVTKEPQSAVWAGTLNLNGYMTIKTVALAEDSTVARMVRLVEAAQHSTSRTQRIVEVFARYYTPSVLIIAAGMAIIPTIMRKENWHSHLYMSLVVLICACPCALVLSTPIATACALSRTASEGVLVKGGDFLETLARVRIVAFDKTGTITSGKFSVAEMVCLIEEDDISLDMLLYWVSSVESKSNHPMAAAFVDYGRSRQVEPAPEKVEDFQNFPGEGVYGIVDGAAIYIGNKKMALRAGCNSVPNINEQEQGATLAYVFLGRKVVGMFSLYDEVRHSALGVIRELKKLGIKIVLLTGDGHAAATRVNDQLEKEIDVIHSELLPDEKAQKIVDMKKSHGLTAMVGDGINDAPALAAADVGVAMGASGSAIASEASHVTLMSDDLRQFHETILTGRRTRWKIAENISLSVVPKVTIVVLALCGHPYMWAAVLVDMGACLLVIMNSMLLLGIWNGKGKSPVCYRVAGGLTDQYPCLPADPLYKFLKVTGEDTSESTVDIHEPLLRAEVKPTCACCQKKAEEVRIPMVDDVY
ncbi:hypothetical protein AMTR_s00038p00036580 [Amborella trichopoda]|uniref:HMA domain-containing protein n=1 Tax=Amborella trichopoda TaxID=13333 RepID=U5CWL0_AMBTC|nr:hypothetical protein AMTR_s00038p00036580 [Amborella trichopoda]